MAEGISDIGGTAVMIGLLLFLFKEAIITPVIYRNNKINERIEKRLDIYRQIDTVLKYTRVKTEWHPTGNEQNSHMLEPADRHFLVDMMRTNGHRFSKKMIKEWQKILKTDKLFQFEDKNDKSGGLYVDFREFEKKIEDEIETYFHYYRIITNYNFRSNVFHRKEKIEIQKLLKDYQL